MFAIRLAHDGDQDRLQRFLALANVTNHPTCQKNAQFLFVEELDKKKIVATVGLEVYQSAGMLRSFVIDSSVQDARISCMLIDLILAYAKKLSLKKIYLITEKGPQFFEKWGFQETSFDLLPNEAMKSEHVQQWKDRGIPMVYEI